MEPAKVPTKERMLEMLKKIEVALPDLKERVSQGIGDKVEEEGMVVLACFPKGIVSVSFKEFAILFNAL